MLNYTLKNPYLRVRTISNIYNFKLLSYCLQIKNLTYVHDRKLFTILNNLNVGKGKSSITEKKLSKI